MPNLITDPAVYGSKGQSWVSGFVEYMVFIVQHPAYAGMPDAVKNDGKIQWEAPSNRKSGQYQHTHHKRRDWWRAKAISIGIDPTEDQWISRTAKNIHPTGIKPCKRCGREFRLAYVYPSSYFLNRCSKRFGPDFVPDRLEEIGEYVNCLTDAKGMSVLDALPSLLKTTTIKPPSLGRDLDAWLEWIEDVYVPQEPSLLGPGAMSNAPDRFDGFHSFNRCCRGTADTGRHPSNMRSYTTDRRVFEYWSEGDWIAADRMMGLVKAKFNKHPSADGGQGAPTADHIGPLSLGFAHRPEFRLLSRSANSAKNNRMTLWDVEFLRSREAAGVTVASWYAQPIWTKLQSRVANEEHALRLSKIMRDNQRQALEFLGVLFSDANFGFLASLLELRYADYNIEFANLRIEDYVTVFDEKQRTPRTTKYARQQKARRLRIGFEALRRYVGKSNRHFHSLRTPGSERELRKAQSALSVCGTSLQKLDNDLKDIFNGSSARETELRAIVSDVPKFEDVEGYQTAKNHLVNAMEVVAAELEGHWRDDRYVRAEFAFDGD